MKVWKLRHTKTGLYRTAGYYGGFNKNGKSWASKAALGGHLALYHFYDEYSKELKDLEIVELETTETATYNAWDYVHRDKK